MLSTMAVVRLLPRPPFVPYRPARGPARWISLLALATFATGLALPLMRVEKFRFWDNEYSVLSASGRMLDEDAAWLAVAVLLFVVVLPLARFAVLALVRWVPTGARLQRFALVLEHWAMLDVFGLALLVVVAKIGDVASVELRAGFWVLLAAAALSLADARGLRRGPLAAGASPADAPGP
jgi:uncharacterized paraquat-inducible protein A